MDLELTQIHEYKVFKDTGKAQFHNGKAVTPDGFQKIRVHFVYAFKHDGRFKARLVADGHLTKEPVESIYSGVVSLRSLRMVVFLPSSMIWKSGEQMLEMHILKPILMKSYASLLDTIPTKNGRELVEKWVSELKDKFLGPNWQRMLSCAYTTQLLHSTGEVCWNNRDSYFIWFEFVC